MRITIILFLTIISLLVSGQEISFERLHDNCKDWNPTQIYGDNYVLYNNSSNYYRIIAEGTFCEDLEVTIDSGFVVKKGCEFNIHPQAKKWKWEFNIYIRTVFGIDTIKPFLDEPPPIRIELCGLAYRHFGMWDIQLDSLKSIHCHRTESETIDSFEFIWTRGDSTLFSDTIITKYFPKELSNKFKSIAQKEDVVQIKKLWYSRNGQQYYNEEVWQTKLERAPFR
jgi:hypothetical protein